MQGPHVVIRLCGRNSSGATAAMEAGLSLAQIRAIGGWDGKAVMLYWNKELQFLRKIGFAS